MTRADETDAPSGVVVVVVRSGGIAGIRKQWRAEPPASASEHWLALIDQCPWDDADDPAPGADRFVWHIRARADGVGEREAELADSRLAGPWRTLVDEVRGAATT